MHYKYLNSTNMLERLHEEIRRRTRVARIFPNEQGWLRPIRIMAAETHIFGKRLIATLIRRFSMMKRERYP